MKATDVLKEEHRVIERMLKTLESGARFLEAGFPVRPGFFLEAVDFFKGFADGCHHKKEEDVLFVSMEANGIPSNGGPIGAMLCDHEMGRAYIRSLKDNVLRWQEGDEAARSKVVQNAQYYTALLRQHIVKEDNILFPLADRVIPIQQQDQVWNGFEKVEQEEIGVGIHEKYLAMAESLEKEVRTEKAKPDL